MPEGEPRRGTRDASSNGEHGASRYAPGVSNLVDITDAPLLAIWGEEVSARQLAGERISFALIELDPNAAVPEHRHEQEQLGMVIRGQVTFTIDGETRTLGPGGTWRILSNRPHSVVTGPDGAEVLDIFGPARDDWGDRPVIEGRAPRWPLIEGRARHSPTPDRAAAAGA